MNLRLRVPPALALATTALLTLAPLANAAAYKAPRNGFGQPDLTGTWSNETITRMERQPQYADRLNATPEDVKTLEGAQAAALAKSLAPTDPSRPLVGKTGCEAAATAFAPNCSYNDVFRDRTTSLMRVGSKPRTSLITFPANGRIPRAPGGPAAKPRPDAFAEGKRDNPEDRILPERCLVSQNVAYGALLNPTVYNNTYVFQQGKDTVAIVIEMSHDTRLIRLNAKHDGIRRWLGDSVGHWEGDTLVVDTVDFNPEQLEYNTDKLHLTERFTRVAPDRILYQFKVEDPGAYTEPWGGEYEFSTAKAPQYEYACHEGNYAMTGMLAGAREDERKAAQAKGAVQAAAGPTGR